MDRGRLLLTQGLIAVLAVALATATFGAPQVSVPSPVESLRQSGDLAAQRRHVWTIVEAIVSGPRPPFESWQGEGSLFAAPGSPSGRPGMTGFNRPPLNKPVSAGAPVIAYSLYNPAAYAHVRQLGLMRAAELDRLRKAGDLTVPAFPVDAMVVKTAWWPVAREGLTAMPVWDPADNPPDRQGNPYLNWTRAVAVDPSARSRGATAAIGFMGRTYPEARRVKLGDFHYVAVDRTMADRLGRDPESRRSAIVALGRPIRSGDYLVLTGINLMTREQADWVWAAFWWHDQPQAGPFAAGRPESLAGPWRNYLMEVAFDATMPRAQDGGPHIAFNPWLEGRFPDGGHGAGAVSNCMACHARASYPAQPFLPVTRGMPDPALDSALAPDKLRTSFLWSLALHAQ